MQRSDGSLTDHLTSLHRPAWMEASDCRWHGKIRLQQPCSTCCHGPDMEFIGNGRMQVSRMNGILGRQLCKDDGVGGV